MKRPALSWLLPMVALSTLSLSLVRCGWFDPDPPGVALVVGSRKVPIDRVRRDIEYFALGLRPQELESSELREQILERIIDHYLILEYGKRIGVVLSDAELQAALNAFQKDYPQGAFGDAVLFGYFDYEEWRERLAELLQIRKVMTRVNLEIAPPTLEEIQRFYNENRERYNAPRRVRFRQIVTERKEQADALFLRLKNREDMGQLAREYSIGPEAVNGGEVGWVEEGHLDELMEKAVFSLGVGNTSPVVQTPYGYHIFQVLDERPAGARSLPEAMKEIEAELLRERQEANIGRWLKNLREDFKVSVNWKLVMGPKGS